MGVTTIKPRVHLLDIRVAKSQVVQRRHNRPDYRTVMRKAGYLCEICGDHAADEVDHIVPLHMGGGDHIGNKQAVCGKCHKTKSAREAKERSGPTSEGET